MGVESTMPSQVERGGLTWNLIDRNDGSWGIQQGLSHQGVLEQGLASELADRAWRVVTADIAYTAPDEGFATWSDAIDDFLASAGSDAIDTES